MNKPHRRIMYTSIILAWLLFIGIDFLFHASLLASFWNEPLPALKSLDDLAILIPAGYLSFFLLTALIGFTFFNIFKTKPELISVLKFGFIFGFLFSLSNVLGLFSYIELPLKQLLIFNLVYFIEIFMVSLCLYYFSYLFSLKKSLITSFSFFIGLIITGIIIQNINANI